MQLLMDLKIHLHICYYSIVNFGIGGLYLGFSKNSHVDSLDRFRISVVDKVKTDVCIYKKYHNSK